MIHFLYKHRENYCPFKCFILCIFQLGSFIFCFLKCLYSFLNFTFPLQELQNIGSVPHVVQYILEPTLQPTAYTSHSPLLLSFTPLPAVNH